jgi:hypothetical protein
MAVGCRTSLFTSSLPWGGKTKCSSIMVFSNSFRRPLVEDELVDAEIRVL